MTLPELNELNSQFWLQRAKLMDTLLEDDVVLSLAAKDADFEYGRIAIKQSRSYDQLLIGAEKTKKIVQAGLARQGGRAPKTDALQDLVRTIVVNNPNINQRQLLEMLEGELGAGTVTAVDSPLESLAGVRMIYFTEDDGSQKTAPLSGLKDRLCRAKKFVRESR